MTTFLSASLALAVAGLLASAVLYRVPLHSWRLRSWLITAVLLQGVMLVRIPVHLGWIDPIWVGSASEAEVLSSKSSDLSRLQIRMPSASESEIVAISAGANPSDGLVNREHLDAWNWSACLLSLWVIGMTAIVLRSIYRYLCLLHALRKLDLAPDAWQAELATVLSARQGVSCEFLVSDSAGPMLVRRPQRYALVVPLAFWAALTAEQRRGVMLHELAHLDRRDVWRQLLVGGVATLHWFNPIAWWAQQQYELACECACDQRVANDGNRSAAGFAAAIVQLVQWHEERRFSRWSRPMLGSQCMAAPPLTDRIARLLHSNPVGDSAMKRLIFSLFLVVLVSISLFQFRLTTVHAQPQSDAGVELRVMDKPTAAKVDELASQLEQEDKLTESFAALLRAPHGRIVVAGYLNELSAAARRDARDEAVPRFVEHHFSLNQDGRLSIQESSRETMVRWRTESEQLAENIHNLRQVTDDIASKLDDSTEAGGLFKRLMLDPQAPVAVLMGEMDGGDVISRYLSDSLGRILVEEGNGAFRIVDSRREEAEKQIQRFENAARISERLKRELARLADEYATEDEPHRELVRYLKHPVTASVVAMQISENFDGSVAQVVNRLHERFEEASGDTRRGLEIREAGMWDQLQKIYQRVDRADAVLAKVRIKLGEVAETLSLGDPLTARLAKQMKQEPLAVMLAADLPYAEADPGAELRAMLSEVLSESNGKYKVRSEVEEKVAAKATELLQTCRRIRRHLADIDELLTKLHDRQFVEETGEAGRYMMLDQIRRYAETFRPDPIALMQTEMLETVPSGKWKVRADRREFVRELVEQSEAVRDEAAINDF